MIWGLRILCTAVLMTGLALGGEAGAVSIPAKAYAPIPQATVALMSPKETDTAAPILIRTFKKESELEVWKLSRSGRYVLLKTFPVCRWSGQLGPKTRQGDRQTPEGFYAVTPQKMNPNSAFHLSFDLGYPNAFDRAHGRTGSYLMVHGTCSSAGCFAMTDAQISEIYALAREAFAGGQRAFQVQAYPFRMTAQNMARARSEPHIEFWRQLKEGYDRFEATGEEPAVGVSGGRYVFAPSKSPAREAAAQARRAQEDEKIAKLVADGSAAVRVTYSDGGQHAVFASLSRQGMPVGEVSRPEALRFAGREIVITPARKKPVMVANAKPPAPPPGLGPDSGGLAAVFAPTPLGPIAVGPDRQTAGAMGSTVIAGSAGIMPAAWSPRPPEVLARRGA